MKSNICLICKCVISDHSRRENIECALKLCNGIEVADIASTKNDTFPHFLREEREKGKVSLKILNSKVSTVRQFCL